MKSLTIDTSQNLVRAGTLKLPVRNNVAIVGTETPAEPQQTSDLSQWLQQVSQTAADQGSVATLLNLLRTVQQLFPEAVPELLAPLLHKLQPFVLEPRQVSDARRLRQQAQRSGLFLESGLAADDAALPDLTEDLKLQLFQILALMDPARQLALVDSTPAFVDGTAKSAHGLQGLGAYGGKGARTGQVQAYLQCSHNDPEGGVSDGQLNPWLQQQVEDVLRHLAERQLQSRQHADGSSWQLELLLRHGDDVIGVPVAMANHDKADPPHWQLAFALELPQLGKVGITMTITGNRVELDYCSDSVLSVATRQRHWRALQQSFATRHLLLTTLNHRLERHA
ncbi:MAG TPA: hypothetical protein VMH83_13785 [Candidatus Acidoferrum sp.]|nr:hypothetical protein [Candidatus Acidoferrum sp.]